MAARVCASASGRSEPGAARAVQHAHAMAIQAHASIRWSLVPEPPRSPPGSCYVFIERCPKAEALAQTVAQNGRQWMRDTWGEDPANGLRPTSAESEAACHGRGFADYCGISASEVQYHWNRPLKPSPPLREVEALHDQLHRLVCGALAHHRYTSRAAAASCICMY